MRPLRSSVSEKSLILMGVPKRFANVTLDDFNTFGKKDLAQIKAFVGEFLENITYNLDEGRGILFLGSNGVGKSMLASIILKEAYKHRYSCRRVTFSKYMSEYTSSWNKSGDDKDSTEQEVFEKYKAAEFLVLEEIGKEIDSKIAKPILEDLLRYREEHGLSTVICTNLSMKVLKEDYGESVYSILTGTMTPITIVGKDRRPQCYMYAWGTYKKGVTK